MAEEEIVIIEGEEEEEHEEHKEKKEKKDGKKKKLIILIATILSLIIISIILYFVLSQDEVETISDFNVTDVSQRLMQRDSSVIKPSELESMIKKANILYEEGNKVEALKLFERISSFSEAISNYNLGVAEMREKNYSYQ